MVLPVSWQNDTLVVGLARELAQPYTSARQRIGPWRPGPNRLDNIGWEDEALDLSLYVFVLGQPMRNHNHENLESERRG